MTPTELTSNFPDWKSLFGKTLDGGYELKEIVEAEREKATFRVRVLGDYSLKASASFFVLEETEAHTQVALWEAVRSIENKRNLSLPLGTGFIEVSGIPMIYLVSQTADEALEDVLNTRILEAGEATEVLRSIVMSLEELHATGFVHGCVSPREVLAVNDRIELSTDSLRRANAEPIVERRPAKYLAPESGPRNLTAASDIWCLGATLFEALTQKTYEPALLGEAEAMNHPFGTLLSCCLNPDPDKRCKLDELDQITRSKAPPPKPKLVLVPPIAEIQAVPPTSSPVRVILPKEVASVAKEAMTPANPVELPKAPHQLPKPEIIPEELVASRRNLRNEATYRYDERIEKSPGTRGWIYGALGFLVLFFLFLLFRTGHRSPSSTASSPPPSVPTNAAPMPAVPSPAPAWPTKTLSPDAKANTAAATPAVLGAQRRTIWRVVLFTYNREQDAEKKAKFANAKKAELHAEVFSPSGSGKPYLVVAGGRMTREEATRERLRAIRAGMPRESYIQNYSH